MPVQIQGIVELRKALRQLSPDLEKNMNREIRAAMQPVVRSARAYVPNEIVGLRTGFMYKEKPKRISKNTSAFARRKFPKFNAAEVKSGITFSTRPSKRSSKGWVTAYAIVNNSAAGAIYETAGRINGKAQEWVGPKGSANHDYSHSNNPEAGQHFINAMGTIGMHNKTRAMRGRLIFRAWDENQGRALARAVKAIEATAHQFDRRMDSISAFRNVA
jgi:hypothetical protein